MFTPHRVRDIELSRPFEPADGADRGAPLNALVRWHGVPLGRFIRGAGECPASTADVLALLPEYQRRLLLRENVRAALEAQGSGPVSFADIVTATQHKPSGPFPLVTVAVCTRDRPDDLAICLDSLLCVEYPALDLLVVDNAPRTQGTARLIATRYSTVRLVIEPKPGLDRARNRAIREARGEILAFADDDTVVDPGWVAALVNVFRVDPVVMAVTGLVVPFELETEAQDAFERYGGFGRGFERRWHSFSRREGTHPHHIGSGIYGTGANMAYRRTVFDQIGEFDPALDVGTPTDGGGDLDMFFRVVEHEMLLVYEPAAVVRHRHRRSFAELRRQIVGWGTGFYSYLARNASRFPERRWAIIRFGVWYLWWRYVKGLVASLRAPWSARSRLLRAEARGVLLSLARYRRARNLSAWLDDAPAG